ncbi:MAG: hypothetical protein HQK50_07400 [Oligoflexia bacterium]|nr:hypothetical protein [Oligoflexia bacterium]MBF0365380.1 hypothetical protein [Oligoflexia bacterium]
MFYIINFFTITSKHPLRGLAFFLSSILLLVVLYQGPYLKKKFWHHFGEDLFYPHFYTLISVEKTRSLNEEEVKSNYKKIAALPGIYRLEVEAAEKLQTKITQSLNELDKKSAALADSSITLASELATWNYYGMKIFLDPGISLASYELIKKYLERLYQNHQVEFTPLKNTPAHFKSEHVNSNSNTNTSSHSLLAAIKKWGDKVILIFALIVWSLSFFLLAGKIMKVSMIMEMYQRRKLVALKTSVSGLICLHLLIGLPTLLLSPPWPSGVITSVIICLLFALTTWRNAYEYFDKI